MKRSTLWIIVAAAAVALGVAVCVAMFATGRAATPSAATAETSAAESPAPSTSAPAPEDTPVATVASELALPDLGDRFDAANVPVAIETLDPAADVGPIWQSPPDGAVLPVPWPAILVAYPAPVDETFETLAGLVTVDPPVNLISAVDVQAPNVIRVDVVGLLAPGRVYTVRLTGIRVAGQTSTHNITVQAALDEHDEHIEEGHSPLEFAFPHFTDQWRVDRDHDGTIRVRLAPDLSSTEAWTASVRALKAEVLAWLADLGLTPDPLAINWIPGEAAQL